MLQKINFSWRVKLIIFFFVIFLVNGMTWIITKINQKAGLYSIEGDSIAIPIMSTIGISLLLMLLLLITIGLLSKKISTFGQKSINVAWPIVIKILLLLVYVPAFFIAIYGVVYWSCPGHYSIAASYLILGSFFLVALINDWKSTV